MAVNGGAESYSFGGVQRRAGGEALHAGSGIGLEEAEEPPGDQSGVVCVWACGCVFMCTCVSVCGRVCGPVCGRVGVFVLHDETVTFLSPPPPAPPRPLIACFILMFAR